VAYGRIARAVAQRLRGWEVELQAYDPYVEGTVSLDTLLTTSDVISIHTPRTRETRGLIGRRELALMKPTAILINTSPRRRLRRARAGRGDRRGPDRRRRARRVRAGAGRPGQPAVQVRPVPGAAHAARDRPQRRVRADRGRAGVPER